MSPSSKAVMTIKKTPSLPLEGLLAVIQNMYSILPFSFDKYSSEHFMNHKLLYRTTTLQHLQKDELMLANK